VQQHQREQPDRFGFGQQIHQQPSEADRFGGEVVAHQRRARRSRIAFVEHEIDHAQDGVEPVGQFRSLRYLIWNPCVADLGLGADDPLRERGRRRQEGSSDFFGREPAHFAQRQGHLGIGCERRMAAREDQSQPVIFNGFPIGPGIGIDDRDVRVDTCVLERVEPGAPAQAVDRLEASRRDEPRTRVGGHAFARPLFERGSEGILQRLFRRVEIPEQAYERREDAPRLGHVQRVDLLANVLWSFHNP
jgi:hypothetical protein